MDMANLVQILDEAVYISHSTCSRKNLKLLFCVGIALAVGVWIYIFHPMRMTDAILPRLPPRGNIKDRTNHFSPSFFASSLLGAGQTNQHERTHSLSSLLY